MAEKKKKKLSNNAKTSFAIVSRGGNGEASDAGRCAGSKARSHLTPPPLSSGPGGVHGGEPFPKLVFPRRAPPVPVRAPSPPRERALRSPPRLHKPLVARFTHRKNRFPFRFYPWLLSLGADRTTTTPLCSTPVPCLRLVFPHFRSSGLWRWEGGGEGPRDFRVDFALVREDFRGAKLQKSVPPPGRFACKWPVTRGWRLVADPCRKSILGAKIRPSKKDPRGERGHQGRHELGRGQ